MIVICGCGAKLFARADQAGKCVRCGKCQEIVPVPDNAVEIDSTGAGAIRAPLQAAAPVPWEVYTVLALLTLNLIGNIVSVAQGGGAFACAVVFNVLVIMGVWQRAAWAWWVTVILSILGFGLMAWLLTAVRSMPDVRVMPALIVVSMVQAALQAGLLICARLRGSYD